MQRSLAPRDDEQQTIKNKGGEQTQPQLSYNQQPTDSQPLSSAYSQPLHLPPFSQPPFSSAHGAMSLAPVLAGPSSDNFNSTYNNFNSAQLQPSPNGSSHHSSSSHLSYQSADDVGGEPGSGLNAQTAEGAPFQTTFYDPFRIKHRRRTTPGQLKILEGHFVVNAKPDVALRNRLADQLDMSPREVQVWFQNRRAKTKKLREKAEKEGEESPESHSTHPGGAQPTPLALPSQLHSFGAPSNDLQSLRRGSSPAVLSNVGGRYLDANEEFASQHQKFNQQQQQQQHYALPQTHQPQPQQPYRQPQFIAQPHNGAYTASPSHSPENSFNNNTNHIEQPFDQNAHLDAHGRRFSMPAYSYNDAHQQQNNFAQLQPSAIFAGQAPLSNLTSAEDLISPSSTHTSPNFGSFSNDNLRGEGDFSPSSSADELSSSAYGYSQPQHVYPAPGYSFGAGAPLQVPQDPMTPVFLPPAVDFSQSPDGFDGGRRSSCPPEFNAAFNQLGLASPAQQNSLWQGSQNMAYLPPQLPNGAQFDPASHPALLQKRHSVANGHLPGTGLGGTYNLQTGQFVPASTAQPAYSTVPAQQQQQQPYQPGSFLQTNLPAGIGAALASRRGSTSSLLGTIAEQPGPDQHSTRLAYGVTADEYSHDGDEQNGYPTLERRGSLVGPAAGAGAVARKARSQQSLRSSPYGQDPNRRSPNSQHERSGSNGAQVEYGGPY